jgi:hypothetical protein
MAFLRATLCLVLGALPGTAALGSEVFSLADHSPDRQAHADASLRIMDAEHFESLITSTIDLFQPYAALRNARITQLIHWNSSGAGAFTFRKDGGRTWEIWFYDGITRLPYVTDDLVRSLVCHELGHHLAGYPFKDNGWAAAEGQADYFAIHACLPEVWQKIADSSDAQVEELAQVDPLLRTRCQSVFDKPQELALCLRKAQLMETMRLYGAEDRRRIPDFDTPDPTKVTETTLSHPAPQCRLDTQLAAMLCAVTFQLGRIPGLGSDGKGRNTLEAEIDSDRSLCGSNHHHAAARRPRCWFASLNNPGAHP